MGNKIYFILSIILLTTLKSSYAQLENYLINAGANTNYNSITLEMEDYLDSLEITLDSLNFYSGDGEFKNFKKFEKYWMPRVDNLGSFETYFEAVEDYYSYQKIIIHISIMNNGMN